MLEANYAVRGAIPIRGAEIQKDLTTGKSSNYNFTETVSLNIGNPQQVGQGTLTFNREVLAGLIYDPLLKTNSISHDAKARIEEFKRNIESPSGAYTVNSKGWSHVRNKVAEFISNRDGVKADADKIYLTNGASEGVRTGFTALIRNSHDGILVPIPQYPLYSALLTLNNAELIPYYLKEEKGWGLDPEALEKQIVKAKENGFVPRGIVVINPGNPTGQVMKRDDLVEIIKICHRHSVLIMADEVYQQNIYKEGAQFVSMRKVLHEMGDPYSNSVELISFNSVSKGMMGECGLRGGYFETHNLPTRAEEMIYKLKSIELCSNTIGQAAVELMINPPKKGRESDACVAQYNDEFGKVMNGLKARAKLLTSAFNSMKNITCTEIEGAMYGFPRVHFSQKFIDSAKSQGKQPDFLYCLDMVNETGIMTVPGSGFGQEDGTYHFRITNLVTPTERMGQVLDNLKVFNEKWQAKH